jgi:hypothetical protein
LYWTTVWQIFTSKDNSEEGTKGNKTNKAKELLAQYGGAYLVTSISLSLVSFALCYALVQGGVDVPALLEKVCTPSNLTIFYNSPCCFLKAQRCYPKSLLILRATGSI